MKQDRAPIISNHEVMPGVHLIWLESPQVASAVQPGQFVMVSCGEGFECLLRRPFSIHRVVDEKLALLFKVIGKGTKWLSQRKEAEFLDLLGPLGHGFGIQRKSKKLLLIAGGIGISPLIFLADRALAGKHSVRLLLGAETASEIYPQHLLPPRLESVAFTVDGSMGWKEMVTGLLPQHAVWADQIFACGPVSMYRTMVAQNHQLMKAKSAEISLEMYRIMAAQNQRFLETKSTQISLEMYRTMLAQSQRLLKAKSTQISLEMRMGCGLGVCYGCTVKTKRGLKQVCRDGPVFDLEDISGMNSLGSEG